MPTNLPDPNLVQLLMVLASIAEVVDKISDESPLKAPLEAQLLEYITPSQIVVAPAVALR